MSAPDTNTPPKEARRHRPALLAIAAAILFGFIMFMAIGFEATDDSDDPAMSAPPMESAPEAGAPVTETPDATERVPSEAAPATTPDAPAGETATGQ